MSARAPDMRKLQPLFVSPGATLSGVAPQGQSRGKYTKRPYSKVRRTRGVWHLRLWRGDSTSPIVCRYVAVCTYSILRRSLTICHNSDFSAVFQGRHDRLLPASSAPRSRAIVNTATTARLWSIRAFPGKHIGMNSASEAR